MIPTLSVIVPVYNVEAYIDQCLGSILENDLRPEEFEVVVVDDESPDRSLEKVAEWQRRFSNIKVISQKNTGISGARNTGLRNAEGEFILFVDSDDWLAMGSLRHLLRLADHLELDILEFGIEKVGPKGEHLGKFSNGTQGKVNTGIRYYKECRYVNSVFNKVYRRSFLLENQLFFIEKIYVEDFELNTRAFLKANRVAGIPDLAYKYRQSPNSITRSGDPEKKKKMIEDHVTVLSHTHSLFQQNHTEEARAFLGERMSFLVVSIFHLMMKMNASGSELKAMKARLEALDLYQITYPIHQRNKEYFRRVMKRNFRLLSILKRLSNRLLK